MVEASHKLVADDYSAMRSGLLNALYRWIDIERVNAFRDAMTACERNLEETVKALVVACINCAAEMTDEFHALGATLGSQGKGGGLAGAAASIPLLQPLTRPVLVR